MPDPSDLKSGDKIRLKEPPSIPSQLHGELVEVEEVKQLGPSSFAVRFRDPFQYEGGTERDEDDFAQNNVLCPYTVISKHYEIPHGDASTD